jgi:hypothetical protein
MDNGIVGPKHFAHIWSPNSTIDSAATFASSVGGGVTHTSPDLFGSGVSIRNIAGASPMNFVFPTLYQIPVVYNGITVTLYGWRNDTGFYATGSPTACPTAPTGSLSGTAIPPATSITDSSGNAWTVVGLPTAGVVYENGATAGLSSSVIMLLWYQGNIYQENSSLGWWEWNGTSWGTQLAGDPRSSQGGGVFTPANPAASGFSMTFQDLFPGSTLNAANWCPNYPSASGCNVVGP